MVDHKALIGLSTDLPSGGTTLNPMLFAAQDDIYSEETALLERLGNIIRDNRVELSSGQAVEL